MEGDPEDTLPIELHFDHDAIVMDPRHVAIAAA
jgi:hypothetical protein